MQNITKQYGGYMKFYFSDRYIKSNTDNIETVSLIFEKKQRNFILLFLLVNLTSATCCIFTDRTRISKMFVPMLRGITSLLNKMILMKILHQMKMNILYTLYQTPTVMKPRRMKTIMWTNKRMMMFLQYLIQR